LDDRPPLKGQLPLPTKEMQSILPPTNKIISNVVQTSSKSFYGFQNLLLDDMPPFKGQLPLPTKEMQSILPPTNKIIPNVV
jgi:hypothetical protein